MGDNNNPTIPSATAASSDSRKRKAGDDMVEAQDRISTVEDEVHSICEKLTARITDTGERYLVEDLKKPVYFQLAPIELHAITKRCELHAPTPCTAATRNQHVLSDFGNVLDFCQQLRHLTIRHQSQSAFGGTSNIKFDELAFSLSFFKNLQALWLLDCNAHMISGLDTIRRTVKYLVVHYTLKCLKDLLLNTDDPLLTDETSTSTTETNEIVVDKTPLQWPAILEADFSFNQIVEIDYSIVGESYLCNIERLDLSNNSICDVGFSLRELPRLRELNLSSNGLEIVNDWHLRIGNVKKLNLSKNSIRSLAGLSRLYSLERLDVTDNSLSAVTEVWPVAGLPLLKSIHLKGNPVISSVEYRSRVLEAFKTRAKEVRLDGKTPSKRELDQINVRLAIRAAKEAKQALAEKSKQQINEKLSLLRVSEEDLDQPTTSGTSAPLTSPLEIPESVSSKTPTTPPCSLVESAVRESIEIGDDLVNRSDSIDLNDSMASICSANSPIAAPTTAIQGNNNNNNNSNNNNNISNNNTSSEFYDAREQTDSGGEEEQEQVEGEEERVDDVDVETIKEMMDSSEHQ